MGDFISLLGSGKDFGCELTYRVQDESGGIAQALGLAERFACNQPMCVILGDNVFEDDICELIEHFMDDSQEAIVMLKEVEDAHRFGVAELQNGNTTVIKSIVEKPANPPSNFAVTGIYCYPPDVFDIIRGLRPSSRGELEITDVNNEYIRQSRIKSMIFSGYWSDAGTFESLARANELVRMNPPRFGSAVSLANQHQEVLR